MEYATSVTFSVSASPRALMSHNTCSKSSATPAMVTVLRFFGSSDAPCPRKSHATSARSGATSDSFKPDH